MTILEWTGSESYAGYLGATPSDEDKLDWYPALPSSVLPPPIDWEARQLTQYLGQGKKHRKPKPIGDAPASR